MLLNLLQKWRCKLQLLFLNLLHKWYQSFFFWLPFLSLPFLIRSIIFFSLQIGSAFVQQYYHILHQSPESVYKFYQDTSMLSRSDADGVMTSVTTMQVFPCFSVQTMFYLVIFFINLLMLGNNVCA